MGPILPSMARHSNRDIHSAGQGNASAEASPCNAQVSDSGNVCLHCCAGQLLPEESSVWPPSAVRELHLSRSAVTADGVAHLTALPSLAFLDVRGTGVPRVRGLRPSVWMPLLWSLSRSKRVAVPAVFASLMLHQSRWRCAAVGHSATRPNPHAPLPLVRFNVTSRCRLASRPTVRAEMRAVGRLGTPSNRCARGRPGDTQAALQPLERRFGLQAVQSAVLTSSNAAAAVAVNWNPVLCACAGRCAPPADVPIAALWPLTAALLSVLTAYAASSLQDRMHLSTVAR